MGTTLKARAAVLPEDPEWYRAEVYDAIADLHEHEPLYFYEPLRMWLVTRYEDVRTVGKTPSIFSVRDGTMINDFRYGNVLASFFPPDAVNFAISDPPEHDKVRAVMQRGFSRGKVVGLKPQIDRLVSQLVAAIEPGEPFDWIEGVATKLPVQLALTFLGLPYEKFDDILFWSDQITMMGAATTAAEIAAVAGSVAPLYQCIEDEFERRRRTGADDFIGTIVEAMDCGEITHDTAAMIIAGVMGAGHANIRGMGAVLALTFDGAPDYFARIRDEPGLAKNAVDELIRWGSVIRGFGRTITTDTDILGVEMHAGDRLLNMYMAANLDPDVFPDPRSFKIDRKFTHPPMSFGHGQHFCLGNVFVRNQMLSLVEGLAEHFDRVSLAGAPTADYSNLFQNHQYTSMPVVLE